MKDSEITIVGILQSLMQSMFNLLPKVNPLNLDGQTVLSQMQLLQMVRTALNLRVVEKATIQVEVGL